MKNVLWQSAQRVIQQILDWLQDTKDESIRERYFDVFEDGVSENELNNMAIIGKDTDVTLVDFLHIKVATGIAYKKGERILIDNSTITYDPTNISDTTDDGFGNLIPTPKSTGSFDVPLTPNVLNFVYIAHLQTIDETTFTLHKITNAKQFYKQTDGYEIIVNTTGVNPDTARFIFLGEVDLTTVNQAITSTISTVNRAISRTKVNKIGIETNNVGLTDRPSSYAVGNEKHSLNDHIKAVGSGTISNTNPHGLTFTDIGITANDLVSVHRINEHENGLIAGTPGDPDPQTSALFAERVIQTLADDFIRIKPLVAGEFAIINGVVFNTNSFPTETIITFTTGPDAAGNYDIFFDSVTGQPDKVLGTVVGDDTKLRLGTVTWDNAGSLGPVLDRRIFGTTYKMARWSTDGRPASPFPGMFGFNLSLNQAEYFNGTIWVQY